MSDGTPAMAKETSLCLMVKCFHLLELLFIDHLPLCVCLCVYVCVCRWSEPRHIIIAVVGIVPVLLILRAIGVVQGMIWQHRCLATRTSPSCSNQGHKHPLTVDSEDQHKVVYLMPVISPMGENADTTDSGVLPYCTGKAISV